MISNSSSRIWVSGAYAFVCEDKYDHSKIVCFAYDGAKRRKCRILIPKGTTLKKGQIYTGLLEEGAINPKTGLNTGCVLHYPKKLESVTTGTNKHRNGVAGEQSQYAGIDQFQVAVKHQLLKENIRPGSTGWNNRLDEAVRAYAAIKGVAAHRSKDTSIWITRWKKKNGITG